MRDRARRRAAQHHATVGVLARVVPIKGLGLVVEALARMPRWVGGQGDRVGASGARALRVQLEVVGDGPLRAPLRALCVVRGVRCVFRREVVGERLHELVRGCQAGLRR